MKIPMADSEESSQKKFDMATLSKEERSNGVLLLNLKPEKVLKGLTRLEVFTGKRVALIP